MAIVSLAFSTVNAQNTPAEPTPDLQLEIAHALLIDVVGYSKLLVNEQLGRKNAEATRSRLLRRE